MKNTKKQRAEDEGRGEINRSPETFIHATKNYEYLRALSQWWIMQTEQYRQGVVGHIQGSMSYGLVVSWSLLPDLAKDAVISNYEAFLALNTIY